MNRTLTLFAVWTLAASPLVAAEQPITKAQSEFFESKIRPILADNCYKCHSATADKVKGGLVVDTREGLLKGGETGPALVPGNPDKSLLIRAVRYDDSDLQMPPKGKKLTAQQIADLTAWVKMGAPDPRKAAAAAKYKDPREAGKSHWAFKPVQKQTPPSVKESSWVKMPVDNFILAKLDENGMKPNAPADRRTLIRRAYFDLIGLPPTPAQVEEFVNDTSSDAFARVVETLLKSPQYGERWGRYWLDVARYSDTKGSVKKKQEDDKYPYAWTYRDYVIKAFNDDKPYNRFIVEQLAADRLASPDKTTLAAMGFLTVGERFMNNQNDIINDRIDTTTKAFLGLTVACARCHDHKFDPVPTADYYSLHGIFASSTIPGELPVIGKPANEAKYAEFQQKLATLKKADATYEAQMKAAKKAKDRKKAKSLQYKSAEIDSKIADLELKDAGSPPKAMIMVDKPRPSDSPIFIRGEADSKGPVVPRRFLEVLSGPARPTFHNGSGRLELAQAIADPKNPLTARAAVNRIWLHHFGEGIVTTPDDLGIMSDPPSHPELLDFLAAYFIEHGWSTKEMHRLIMNSAAYQQSSANNSKFAQLDPMNRLLWRANVRRLDFESMRDSFLFIGGKLSAQMGGAGTNLFSEPYSTRRSVYGYLDREAMPETLNHFDFANPDMATGKRYNTIVPQQSLFLMNSPLVVEQAKNLVRRAEFTAAKTDEDKLDVLYRIVYARPARAEEVKLSMAYLAETKPYRSVTAAPQQVTNAKTQKKKQNNKKRPEAYVEPFKARAPLGSWEELAHTLLIANEASFIN
ncbi:MAG TPA: PSD1 and planctomycete cytochrome C domain-containing protein [Verrucomicrobiae bacterium]|jgi:mono/diheme cytochrome c family protein